MIRVLQIFNSSHVSGPERSVIPGLLELNKLSKIHCEVLFLEESRLGDLQKKSTEYAQNLGLKVHSITVESRYDKGAIEKLRELIVTQNFDVVHAQDVKATVYTVHALKKLPVRIVSTFHGFVRQGWKNKFYEMYYFWVGRKVQDLVAISKGNYTQILPYYKNLKTRVHLIENVITKPESFPLAKREEKLKSLTSSPLIGPRAAMLARFSEEKNHKTLFYALTKLPTSLPFTVWLFGFGPMEQELKNLAKELKIEHRLIFGGYLEQAEKYLESFDFILLTSTTEGLPISLLEGSLLGLPFIGSDIEGIHKVLPPDLGFFAPALDAEKLSQAIQQAVGMTEEKKNQMRLKLLAHMQKNFNHEKWCEQMLALYQESK